MQTRTNNLLSPSLPQCSSTSMQQVLDRAQSLFADALQRWKRAIRCELVARLWYRSRTISLAELTSTHRGTGVTQRPIRSTNRTSHIAFITRSIAQLNCTSAGRLVEANTSPMRRPDIVASNGVIHILGKFRLPARCRLFSSPRINHKSIVSPAARFIMQTLLVPVAWIAVADDEEEEEEEEGEEGANFVGANCVQGAHCVLCSFSLSLNLPSSSSAQRNKKTREPLALI